MTDTLLSVENLAVTYRIGHAPVPAVRGVSFAVDRGACLGLAGESGCGKSTIANAALRLLPRTAEVSGSVLLDGEEVLTMKPGRLRAVRWTETAIVFQGALHALNPVQRVAQQIAEPMLLHRTAPDREAARERTATLLDQVGLAVSHGRAYPHQLSGGQRQRVLIAMALACGPSLLIADEPTTALDVMIQAQVLDLVKALQRDHGLAMVFITHDLSVLREISDGLVVMYAGRIVERGRTQMVTSAPDHPYSAALVVAFPTIGDRATRLAPAGLPGDPPDPTRLPSGCPFHPRCAKAMPACATVVPVLASRGGDRSSACLLTEPNR